MSSLLNFFQEGFTATLPPTNFLPTESQSAQPNLHFCFSFPSSATHRLFLIHVKLKEQDLRRSTGVNPSSLNIAGSGGRSIRPDQRSSVSFFFSFSCPCLCVYLLQNGADFISAAQHNCTLSPSGNNDNKNSVRLFFPPYVFFPVGLQNCWFYEPVSFHSLPFNQRLHAAPPN